MGGVGLKTLEEMIDEESQKLFEMNTHREMGKYVIAQYLIGKLDGLECPFHHTEFKINEVKQQLKELRKL